MPHEKVTNEYIEDGGKVTQYELYWSLDEIDWSIETIICEVILADIEGLNSWASSVYLVDTKEIILYHFYDDQGLDVVAKKKETLHSLFNTYIVFNK